MAKNFNKIYENSIKNPENFWREISNDIFWFKNPTKITKKQILDKHAELQSKYDALDFARAREQAYPELKEFAEAYCEKEIGEDSTKWDAYVTKYNKVRADNPKP